MQEQVLQHINAARNAFGLSSTDYISDGNWSDSRLNPIAKLLPFVKSIGNLAARLDSEEDGKKLAQVWGTQVQNTFEEIRVMLPNELVRFQFKIDLNHNLEKNRIWHIQYNMLIENVRSTKDLLLAIKSGVVPNFLFFWGHKPLPNGEIGKSCLSQWWPASFSVNDTSYPTAEHFMMAEKARLFGDEDIRAKILQTDSPKSAKQLGRKVKNFDEHMWTEARVQIVVEGNMAKFSQNHELGKFLMATGNKVLVEASPLDRVWGIGLGADNEKAMNPKEWRGLNLLGFALMEVRHQLIERDM
jgi:ribA/ribD-fused uncharacterized protein